MPVSLSIKNVPEDLLEQLRSRAEAHHRSLQRELLSILEEAVAPPRRKSIAEIRAEVRALGLPRFDADSAELIRQDRDSDHGPHA